MCFKILKFMLYLCLATFFFNLQSYLQSISIILDLLGIMVKQIHNSFIKLLRIIVIL